MKRNKYRLTGKEIGDFGYTSEHMTKMAKMGIDSAQTRYHFTVAKSKHMDRFCNQVKALLCEDYELHGTVMIEEGTFYQFLFKKF